MILPDTCQPTSHQGLSCVTPDDIAWQDQSWATLHPILPPGEVGRTMLIASDPPRSQREIAFIRCNNRSVQWKIHCCNMHKPFQCLYKMAEAFALVFVVRGCGTRVTGSAHLKLFPVNTGACSYSQPSHISQPSWGVIKTCAWTPLHRCCFSAIQEPP